MFFCFSYKLKSDPTVRYLRITAEECERVKTMLDYIKNDQPLKVEGVSGEFIYLNFREVETIHVFKSNK